MKRLNFLLRVAAKVRKNPRNILLWSIKLPQAQLVADLLELHYPHAGTTQDVIRVVIERWNDELPPPADAGEPPWPEGKRRTDTPQWREYMRELHDLREELLAQGVAAEQLGRLA